MKDNQSNAFKVLLVDNSRTTRAVMSKLLVREGFDVDAVQNGIMAIESVQEKSYDLVLMDLYMPQLNGYEAARNIRDLPHDASTLPIIALTASTDSNDVKVCKDAGMTDFFLKSSGDDALINLIHKYEQMKSQNISL